MPRTESAERPQKRVKILDAPLKSALKSSKVANVNGARTGRKKAKVANFGLGRADEVSDEGKLTKKKGKEHMGETRPESPLKAIRVDKGKARDPDDQETASPSYPRTFKIIAGSYEKLLYGIEGTFFGEGGASLQKPNLKPIFIFPAHVSSVKAVAASPQGGKWLATGSTDEIIKVWDLRRRKEVGGLMQHTGSVTHLSFPTRTHLVSASEDGTIGIFHARDWSLLRSLKGHKGRVNCVAVHPSMKVALSVGKDRTLRMWDLMRGKASGSTKLGKEGELVRWSPEGDHFVVQSGSVVDVYSINMSLLHTLTHSSRVHDVRFFAEEESKYLLVAAEDGKVTFYYLPSGPQDDASLPPIAQAVGHENRVKAIDTLTVARSSDGRHWTTIMLTISSDGWMRIFDISTLNSLVKESSTEQPSLISLEPIAKYDTKGSRLTCCSLAGGEAVEATILGKRGNRAKEGVSEAEDDPNDMETELVSGQKGVSGE